MFNNFKKEVSGEEQYLDEKKISIVNDIKEYGNAFRREGYDVVRNFKKVNGNRTINKKHLEDIKSMMKVGTYSFPTIIVNINTNAIIDGQHRCEAYKELVEEGFINDDFLLGVQYVFLSDEEEMSKIIDCNTNSKQWSLDTYINGYIDLGKKDYGVLKDFCERNELCNEMNKQGKISLKYRYAGVLLKGKGSGEQLKSGEFPISAEEYVKGTEIHNEMLAIINELKLPHSGAWIETMAKEWIKEREEETELTFDKWMKGFKSKTARSKMDLKKYSTKQDWVNIFSQAHRYAK